MVILVTGLRFSCSEFYADSKNRVSFSRVSCLGHDPWISFIKFLNTCLTSRVTHQMTEIVQWISDFKKMETTF